MLVQVKGQLLMLFLQGCGGGMMLLLLLVLLLLVLVLVIRIVTLLLLLLLLLLVATAQRRQLLLLLLVVLLLLLLLHSKVVLAALRGFDAVEEVLSSNFLYGKAVPSQVSSEVVGPSRAIAASAALEGFGLGVD